MTGALAWRQLLKLKQLADEVQQQRRIVTPIGPGSDLVTSDEERFREHQESIVVPRVKVLSRRIGLIPILLTWSLRLCATGAVLVTVGLIGHFLLSP
ncbi:MAG: hypothetical protein SH850_09175 [Planctomycetaceae bacterium]|nr:hypothetical protein [Planctomycetaceae bacterium]